MSTKNLICSSIWLILLLFNFKIYGVYIINLISVLLLIHLLIKNKKFDLKNLLLLAVIVVFVMAGWINSIAVLEPFKYVFNFFQIFIYFEFFKLNKEKAELKKIIIYLTLAYLSLSIYELSYGSLLWFESRNYDDFLPRINLGFGDANSLAGFLILFSTLLINLNSFFLIFVFLIGVLTFSRAFLIAFLVVFLFRFRTNFFLVISIFCIGLFIFYYFNISENYSFAIERVMDTHVDQDSNPRLNEWLLTLSKLSFIPKWEIFKESIDPHNSLLLAINIFSPVGMIIVFIYLFRILFAGRYNFQKMAIQWLLITFGVFCIFNSELFSVRNTATLGMILGLLYNDGESLVI